MSSSKSKISLKRKRNPSRKSDETGSKASHNVVISDSIDLERCPSCQFPIAELGQVQSFEWHINECIEINRTNHRECEKGLFCDSTILNHYLKFIHSSPPDDSQTEGEITHNRESIPINNNNNNDEEEILIEDENVSSNISISDSVPKKQRSITDFFLSKRPKVETSTTSNLNVPEKKYVALNVIPITKPITKDNKGKFVSLSQNERWTHKRGRECPFYKKIQDSPIAVDAFSYGTIPNVEAYFLSHFHSDHYGGLTRSFKCPIYCSQVTANLVEMKFRLKPPVVRVLQDEVPTIVCGIEVTTVNAYHCPGAVMFIFKYRDGRSILHTGDFRFNQKMKTNRHICGVINADILYLDTTYLDPLYNFPPQDDVVEYAIQISRNYYATNPKTLFVCGAYTIGKEKVFMGISEALKLKFCGSSDKLKTFECLNDSILKLQVTKCWERAQIHVLPMGQLNRNGLKSHFLKYKNQYSQLVAFAPTGWETKSKVSDLSAIVPKRFDNIVIYGIPYSEHSSYAELKQFVEWLGPKKILPTVNVGTAKQQLQILNSWSK